MGFSNVILASDSLPGPLLEPKSHMSLRISTFGTHHELFIPCYKFVSTPLMEYRDSYDEEVCGNHGDPVGRHNVYFSANPA
jgi:hypothetical protein